MLCAVFAEVDVSTGPTVRKHEHDLRESGAMPIEAGPRVADLRVEDLNVVFQPIVELATGRIFAHEALARCKVDAFRSPITLFEQAEREGFCGQLGRMVR